MIPILTSLLGLGTSWLAGKQELQKARQQQEVIETQQRTKLISDARTNNHSWELAALSADRMHSLRMLSFILFTFPILYTVYNPTAAQIMWDALAKVPDWVIGVQLSMTGFIWAAKPLSNLGAMIVKKGKG